MLDHFRIAGHPDVWMFGQTTQYKRLSALIRRTTNARDSAGIRAGILGREVKKEIDRTLVLLA
jgi:hypothetical protein